MVLDPKNFSRMLESGFFPVDRFSKKCIFWMKKISRTKSVLLLFDYITHFGHFEKTVVKQKFKSYFLLTLQQKERNVQNVANTNQGLTCPNT